MIKPLERDLGKPVIAANQATMWQALRLAGINDRVSGFGALYELPDGHTEAHLADWKAAGKSGL